MKYMCACYFTVQIVSKCRCECNCVLYCWWLSNAALCSKIPCWGLLHSKRRMQQPSAACTRAQSHLALVLPAFGCCILLLLLLSMSTQDGLDPLQLAMVVVYTFICHQLTQILHLHALMVAIMQNVLVALPFHVRMCTAGWGCACSRSICVITMLCPGWLLICTQLQATSSNWHLSGNM